MKKIVFLWDWNSIHIHKWVSYFSKNNLLKVYLVSDTKIIDKNKLLLKNDNVIIHDYNITWSFLINTILLFPLKFLIINVFNLIIKPDIIHIHFVSLNVLLVLPVVFSKKIIKIASFWWSDYNIKNKIRHFIRKLVSKYYNIITSDTEEILKWLEIEYKVNKNKLFYINHWVESSKFVTRGKDIMYKNKFVIFSPRWLWSLYSHHILFNNMDLLIETFWKNLLIIFIDYNSEINYKKQLLEISKKYPKNIEIRKTMNQEELLKTYNNSNIVISIPKIDGFPITIIESILSRKVIIWLNHKDYVNNLPNNFLINENKLNINSLIDKIIELKNYEIEEDTRKGYIEKYDYEKNMKKMLSLYIN